MGALGMFIGKREVEKTGIQDIKSPPFRLLHIS